MQKIPTLGIDLASSVFVAFGASSFQVHATGPDRAPAGPQSGRPAVWPIRSLADPQSGRPAVWPTRSLADPQSGLSAVWPTSSATPAPEPKISPP